MPRKNPDKKSVKCSAKKKNGEPCPNWAMEGSTRCHTHAKKAGELTRFKSGPANPQWKTGEHSRYAPKKSWMQSYLELEKDPELLSTRPEIAILTVRLQELIANIDVVEAGQWWEKLSKLKADFVAANAAKDASANSILTELLRTIDAGSSSHMVLDEIQQTMLVQDKLKNSERKRLKEMNAYFTVEEGLAMLHQVGLALRTSLEKHVGSLDVRHRVSNDVGNVIKRIYGSANDAA